MPGAHSCTVQLNLNLIIYTNHGPGSMDSVGKNKQEKSKPVHGPPVQSRVAAANRAVLAVGAMILAHIAMSRGGGGAKQNGGW